MKNFRILLVEDEPRLARLYTRMLESLGHEVKGLVPDGEAAFELAREHCFDVLVTDLLLAGDIDGIKLANMVRSLLGIPSVIMSSLNKDALADLDASVKDYECLQKPFSMEQLHGALVRTYTGSKRPSCGCA